MELTNQARVLIVEAEELIIIYPQKFGFIEQQLLVSISFVHQIDPLQIKFFELSFGFHLL